MSVFLPNRNVWTYLTNVIAIAVVIWQYIATKHLRRCNETIKVSTIIPFIQIQE